MVISFGLLTSLVILAIVLAVKTVFHTWKTKTFQRRTLGWFGAVIVVTLGVLVAVADWRNVRSSIDWTLLPQGNLLTSVLIGWVYVLFFALLVTGLFFGSAKARIGNFVVTPPKASSPRVRRSERLSASDRNGATRSRFNPPDGEDGLAALGLTDGI